MSPGRLWRTVRWLKAEQVVGRLRLELARPLPDLRAPPSRRAANGRWLTPPAREASLAAPARMRFHGVEHDLDVVGWDHPALPLLWRYHQHYFDDLNAQGSPGRRAWHRTLVQRWLEANPPGRGTAWAPYPTSLRIVNWIKCLLGGEPGEPQWLASLAVQARWLTRRLERHLLGNHLFANAKALVFAGLFFDGAEADAWLHTGIDIVLRELPEQILADGAHFERSPMYHLLALEDLLDLVNAVEALAPAGRPTPARTQLLPALRSRVGPMLHWLRCLRHPDGTLARFNDTAEGVAPPADDVERYAAALGCAGPMPAHEGVLALRPSGYVRARRGEALLLADVAPIGPDYLPGHAHADTLSFELSLHGRSIIVNRGTSEYGEGSRRQLERGTAAHSTVQIGGHDSSEVWAGFRVGRRARPLDVQLDGWSLAAAHDGYAHLPGRPLHRRAWQLHDRELVVHDQVVPAPRLPAVARFHLAPGLHCEAEGGGGGRCAWVVRDASAAELARVHVARGSAGVEPWQHARRFGELVPAQTLAVRLDAGAAHVRWAWA